MGNPSISVLMETPSMRIYRDRSGKVWRSLKGYPEAWEIEFRKASNRKSPLKIAPPINESTERPAEPDPEDW
jgi:hypothetical protein